MNTAFLNLAKNDEELITDIKNALISMNLQVQKRETLYLAVEHNTKYLATLALAADKRAVLSDAENSEMREKIRNFKKTQEENERQIKLMQKDSA